MDPVYNCGKWYAPSGVVSIHPIHAALRGAALESRGHRPNQLPPSSRILRPPVATQGGALSDQGAAITNPWKLPDLRSECSENCEGRKLGVFLLCLRVVPGV